MLIQTTVRTQQYKRYQLQTLLLKEFIPTNVYFMIFFFSIYAFCKHENQNKKHEKTNIFFSIR